MEEWEFDFEWLQVRHKIKDMTGRDTLPDMNGILFLIGIQELGFIKEKFTKEEKQDLMHIAVCRLLSPDGYYEFRGEDADGWPHYDVLKPLKVKGVKEQEHLLKVKVIEYFRTMENNDN